MRNTSVAMSSVFISPRSISGAAYQNDALSISTRSRITSHLTRARDCRCSRAFCEPTAGFWPMMK